MVSLARGRTFRRRRRSQPSWRRGGGSCSPRPGAFFPYSPIPSRFCLRLRLRIRHLPRSRMGSQGRCLETPPLAGDPSAVWLRSPASAGEPVTTRGWWGGRGAGCCSRMGAPTATPAGLPAPSLPPSPVARGLAADGSRGRRENPYKGGCARGRWRHMTMPSIPASADASLPSPPTFSLPCLALVR